MKPFELGSTLSLEVLEAVALRNLKVTLGSHARARISESRAAVDALLAQGEAAPAVYGINTGFGALAETRVGANDLAELQRNLIRSHATGVGPALPVSCVRGMMLLRAQVLALGHSGVRVSVVEALMNALNAGVHPRIPSQGSVGASGDLAPLAHLCLALMGEGEIVNAAGARSPARAALAAAGLSPIALEAKEGLSLINGTQYMASLGTLALLDAERLTRLADLAGAMSLEALKGTRVPFDARLHALRPHAGQKAVAANLWALLAESEIAESHANCGKVQDAYSLRCMPQVHGASRDALAWVRTVLECEVNSVTDNPSVFVENGTMVVLSGGNFHGQPLAIALDMAAIAIAEIGNISERRVEQMVNPALSSGLTPFVAAASGLHSGFMIAQVTQASLVAENKILCHPASVDSIPSSAGKEDHVSMGSISAKKLREVVANVRNILAIEFMVAAAGIDQRAPLKPARAVANAHAAIRKFVPPHVGDRVLYPDIDAIRTLVEDGTLLAT
jgi:histidine ammonia-lyase